jgi:tetratricopeptide (TPR) repeat protein
MMTRTLVNLALGVSLAILAGSSGVFAGRGGGRGGGYGGGGYGGGASMGRSPSFSQPRPSTNGARPQGGGAYGDRSQPGGQSEAGARSPYGNTAGAENRNQNPYSNAGSAAAGAGYANRNQGPSNAGAAAAGAGYANRNQNPYSNAGAAALGAGYANRNQYDQYHPGMANGYWNGNYGAWGMGAAAATGVGAWGVGSPMYSYGYSGYSNPYATGMGAAGAVQPVNQPQPAGGAASAPDYSQPLNTAAAVPTPTAADQATAVFDQAREAFRSNDYDAALRLDQQAIAQMPNDATMHELLALVFFAHGKYDQAAGPLYAVLSVGPGWDWTTLIGNYSDANLYTDQLRNLETYVKANRTSAPARFVLAYHYITQGHKDAAAAQLKEVVALQPNDTLSAQLIGKLEPASAAGEAPSAPPQTRPVEAGKLTGDWIASAPQNAKVTLSIKDDGGFTWTIAAPGKPPTSISGKSTLADGTLTLSADQASQMGALIGQVARQDDSHFTFRVTGSPANDPGLAFAR